jgi:hypothetical protein
MLKLLRFLLRGVGQRAFPTQIYFSAEQNPLGTGKPPTHSQYLLSKKTGIYFQHLVSIDSRRSGRRLIVRDFCLISPPAHLTCPTSETFERLPFSKPILSTT